MSSKSSSKSKSNIYYKLACWRGYCPTSEEIENSKVKRLADKLKTESCKETLTNLLEWQDRNITFWTERHPISTLMLYIPIIMLPIFIGMVLLALVFPPFAIFFFSYRVSLIWYFAFISSIVTVLVAIGLILHSNRKIPVMKNIANVFAISLPLNAMLDNRLGVCRDYAKLTACLLLNVYPDADVYFAKAPNHSATGIKIGDNLYMLDQRLPILTIHKWDKYRHLKKLEKLSGTSLNKVDKKTFLAKEETMSIDTLQLSMNMKKLLKIEKQNVDESLSIVEIRWKKGAILYEDEEFVNYSLSKWLKTKIDTELVEITRILAIEVVQDKNDLIFRVGYKSRK